MRYGSNIRNYNIRSLGNSIVARAGFSLVEMLVVIGILAVLIGAGLTSFSSATQKAQKAKVAEAVIDVAAALEAIYQQDNCWPRRILAGSGSDSGITAEIAYDIATKGKSMTLTTDSNKRSTIGIDRMGIVSPWAMDVIKKAGQSSIGESTKVPSGGTIADHRFRYAVDTEGKGFVTASVGGESVTIRGVVMVWCSGRDGVIKRYSEGKRSDDVYSWSDGQRKK